MEPAAQRIQQEIHFLELDHLQFWNEFLESNAITLKNQSWDGLISIKWALGMRLPLCSKGISMPIQGFFVQKAIHGKGEQGNVWLNQQQSPPLAKNPCSFTEECQGLRQVMEHIKQYKVRQRALLEWQVFTIKNRIKPRKENNIGTPYSRQGLFEMPAAPPTSRVSPLTIQWMISLCHDAYK